METSVILNIVFIGLVGLWFICYQIWVGFKLVKTNEKLRETTSEIEKNSNYHDEISKVLELNFNQGDEELRKTIDRLDSRLDGKSKEIYDNLDTSIKLHKIKKLIVINHRDCGAAKIVNGNRNLKKMDETEIHKKSFMKVKKIFKKTQEIQEDHKKTRNLNLKKLAITSSSLVVP